MVTVKEIQAIFDKRKLDLPLSQLIQRREFLYERFLITINEIDALNKQILEVDCCLSTLEKWGLCLMLELPQNGQPAPVKVYLAKIDNKKLKYVVFSNEAGKIEGVLDICVEGELTQQILNKKKWEILQILSERGQIPFNRDKLMAKKQILSNNLNIKLNEREKVARSDMQNAKNLYKRLTCTGEYFEFNTPSDFRSFKLNLKEQYKVKRELSNLIEKFKTSDGSDFSSKVGFRSFLKVLECLEIRAHPFINESARMYEMV